MQLTDPYGHPVPATLVGGGQGYVYSGPSTNQKDGDAMFAVINYKFAEGAAPTMVVKATQADAQEYAEAVIAIYRANIQVKQFFSVSILNLKNGIFIGSVVDAPPAITWTAAA